MDHLNCSRKDFRELLSVHFGWALHRLFTAGFSLQDFHHTNSQLYTISKGVRLKNSFFLKIKTQQVATFSCKEARGNPAAGLEGRAVPDVDTNTAVKFMAVDLSPLIPLTSKWLCLVMVPVEGT